MKKTSFLLLAMAFGLFGMNAQTAQEQKAELAKRDAAPTLRAAAIYDELPSGYPEPGRGFKDLLFQGYSLQCDHRLPRDL